MAPPKFFRISDFSGGYNPDQSPVLLAANEATDILNFRLDKVGSLVSRKGYTKLIATAASSAILSLGALRDAATPANSQVLVHLADGSVRAINTGGAGYDTLATGFGTVKGVFRAAQDSVFYSNGVRRPVRYDGTNVYTLGLDPPGSAPGLTAGSGGSLSGTYKYCYTYVSTSRGIESNPSPVATVVPASQKVTVAFTASGDSTVDEVNIYRTAPGGAVYLYLTVQLDGAGTWDDTGAVALSALAVEVDHDIPGNLESLEYFQGYFFGTVGKTLYWSKPLQPDYWPALNSTEVGFEGIDDIVTLVSHQDALLIFGRRNVLILNGSGGNWQIARLDVAIGATCPEAITSVGGQLVFLSNDGLRLYPGFQVFAPNLQRLLADLTEEQRLSARLGYVGEERSLWLRIDGRTYTVHVPNQGASVYDFDPPDFLAGGADGNSSPLLVAADGLHVNVYGGNTDDSADIPLRWESKTFELDSPETTKFFRRIGAFATTGASGVVTVTIKDRSNVSHSVALMAVDSVEDLRWDAFNWDEAYWPSEGLSYFIGALPADRLFGQTMTVEITAEVSSEVEITPPITFQYREANRFLGG